MASLIQQSNGRKAIQFTDRDKKRRTVYLSKCSKSEALQVKLKIERLNSARIAGNAPDDETARWLASCGDAMLDKLESVGLVETRRKRELVTLGAWLDRYIASRSDLKPRSLDILQRTRRSLLAYFPADKPLADITELDADEFRRDLEQRGGLDGSALASNTANDRCKKARQMLQAAVKHRIISTNPFSELKGLSVCSNAERQHYVTADDTRKVIENALDPEFGLVVALCRFAGLRNPSETLLLRWDDVNLPEGTMIVSSPKTERYRGHESRVVPIFMDLRPYLEAAYDRWDGLTEFVVDRWRSDSKNFRTRLERAIRRSGLKPWPRLFHNLRSSLQTDLEQVHASYLVCRWLGNSERVARDHYLQMTEEHIRSATSFTCPSGDALRNALQQGANSTEPNEKSGRPQQRDCRNFRSIPLVPSDVKSYRDKRYTPQDSNLQPSVP